MKILYLPLKKEWYKMIERGDKREEYREESPYWRTRLIECYAGFNWCDMRGFNGRLCGGCSVEPRFRHFDAVCFSYGYTKRRMLWECKGIEIGRGCKNWGAPDHETFIIKLGNRLNNERLQ